MNWAPALAALARANWALWAAGLGVYLFAQIVSSLRWRMLSPRPGLQRFAASLSRLLLHWHVFQSGFAHFHRRRHDADVVSDHARRRRPAAGQAAESPAL